MSSSIHDDGAMLAGGSIVHALAIALALGIAATTVAAGAGAGADRPVFVTVLGPGHIRLRLAVGITAPCDSTENRMLFDGRLAPGRYRWDTGAQDVCYQHTSSALPDSDWSVSRVISTTTRRGSREILISTD